MPSRRPQRTLRIIGGNWRSRKVSFPDRAEIRPTPDRVRETLFNWLRSDVAGSRCLDLFAGTGILSLEALSRGAAHATVIEQDTATFATLRANFNALEPDTSRYELVCASARDWLANCDTGFDIVFLDPPFDGPELGPTLKLLNNRPELGALVYIESPRALAPDDLPAGLAIVRQQFAGQVNYCLCRRAPS